jgi:hypothetical protein
MYKYQVEIDDKLTFEKAVTELRERCKNRIVAGPIVAEDADWEGNLKKRLVKKGIQVYDYYVHRDDYLNYIKSVNYNDNYIDYYSGNLTEKSLEHFIALKLLDLWETDLVIDIASENSPVCEIFNRLNGCKCYAQDIMFEKGLHGNKIGSDVSSIPIPDNYFTKALATCSIEHFEGNSDIGFMHEIKRILMPNGKIVILPLYLHTKPCIISDPKHAIPGNVSFDEGTTIYCVENWGNRFGRFYSPETLFDRLIKDHSQMHFKVFFLKNYHEIDESIYLRFILVGKKISI